MNIIKKIIDFFWNGLYNRCSIAALNIYNFFVVLAFLILIYLINLFGNDNNTFAFFLLFLSLFVFVIHVVFLIAFILESFHKKLKIRDSFIINNIFYKTISVIGLFLALIIVIFVGQIVVWLFFPFG